MSKLYLTQTGSFRASHSHGGELAEDSHEHDFRFEATFYGEINEEYFLIDFRELSSVLKDDVEKQLNGQDLSEKFFYPTTEALALWIFQRIKPKLPQLYSVKVYEAADRWAEYRGDE